MSDDEQVCINRAAANWLARRVGIKEPEDVEDPARLAREIEAQIVEYRGAPFNEPDEPHYSVQYGDLKGSSKLYCVWDEGRDKLAFEDDSKSTVIAAAQRLNKFKPVDGSEQTYGKQLAKAGRR